MWILIIKLKRLHRWSSTFGLLEALRFEVAWSCRWQRAHVRVPGYRKPFLFRRLSSDISVFETVFVDREFELYVLVAYMDAHPNCGILGVKLVGRDGMPQPSARYFPTPWNLFLSRTGLNRILTNVCVVDDMAWDRALVGCAIVPSEKTK